VLINLGSVTDADYAARMKARVAQLRTHADTLCSKAITAVEATFQ